MTIRFGAILLAVLVCLVAAGCAQRDTDAREQRQGGFYGGFEGGTTRSGSDM